MHPIASTSLSDCQLHSNFDTEPMSIYHETTHRIEFPLVSKMCLTTKYPAHDLQLTPCVAKDITQQWLFENQIVNPKRE